jgi:hypothetical protein
VKGEQLRERVVAALQRSQVLTLQVNDVLAAFGLDDLDAAVERCAQGIVHQEIEDYGWDDETYHPTYPGGVGDLIRERTSLWRDSARRGLEAALTPPETVAKTERDDH